MKVFSISFNYNYLNTDEVIKMANTTIRPDRDTKDVKFYLQDDENTMLYNPSDMY